jgi:hypothetical protein
MPTWGGTGIGIGMPTYTQLVPQAAQKRMGPLEIFQVSLKTHIIMIWFKLTIITTGNGPTSASDEKQHLSTNEQESH